MLVTHSQNSGHPARSPPDLRCVERVVISKTLSRASGKMRNLFPVIPHYWIERRSIILPIGLGLRAVVRRVTILSGPWHSGFHPLNVFILTHM